MTARDFELDHSFGMTIRNEDTSSASSSPATDLFRRLTELCASAAGNPTAAAELAAAIAGTDPADLAAAIRSEANLTERKRVLRRASRCATPAARLKLGRAAAAAYERPMSAVLSALLDKLAHEAEHLPEPTRVAADHAYRDLFDDIIDAWSTSSVSRISSGYDSLFAQEPEETESGAGSVTPEAQRVLALAFETGATGNMLWDAATKVSDNEQGVRHILTMLKSAPAGSRAAAAVAQQFANPQRLAMLLLEDPVDFDTVDALLGSMGSGAAAALIDALAEAKTRSTRRALLDRLVAMGPGIGPLVVSRLNGDNRWYVQRNMLTLLREAKCKSDGVQLDLYLEHADARVRREATQLRFLDPVGRERALAAALRDGDVGMLKVGLRAARSSMPESVVPILAKRVVDPAFPPEFRTSALHLLARSSSMLALEALLRFAMGGTSIFGKPKLAQKSPEMMVALSGLARTWPTERRAAPLIAAAHESKDNEIVRAVTSHARIEAPAIQDEDPA